MNHVVCVKWGNKYIPKYVNVLYNMVQRHTTVPFQFHCLTDDPAGIDVNNINIIKLPTDPWIKTWWSKGNKVAVFHGRPNPMECADQFVVENWK
jgi:urocanate hydratase